MANKIKIEIDIDEAKALLDAAKSYALKLKDERAELEITLEHLPADGLEREYTASRLNRVKDNYSDLLCAYLLVNVAVNDAQ